MLWAPPEYKELTKEQIRELTKHGGCGPGEFGDKLVPDSIFGLNIKPACIIHDYWYAIGTTLNDKIEADFKFYENMRMLIYAGTRNKLLRELRLWCARRYYEAVKYGGSRAFWGNKSDTLELVEV